MAPTKTLAEIQNWTAVAQNTIVESTEYDCSAIDEAILGIQAFLDTINAHAAGTRFIVQVSHHATGDEDWQDLTQFIALAGTAATDLIENNPLNAAETSITLTGHAFTVEGIWIAIEDGTPANSELILEASQNANAIVALNGVTNAHAVNTAVFNIAISKSITIPYGVYRFRVVVDNSVVAAGSSLNFKLSICKVVKT